jgi:uncharacterized protein (DUF1330 family)
MNKLILPLLAALILSFGAAPVFAQAEKKAKKAKSDSAASASATAPKSVIHVVTVAWKPDATPQQIQAALDGVKALPSKYPGITRVWTRSIKVQNPRGTQTPRTHVFVMEFASEQALKDYHESPAQKEWYTVYLPVRAESTTHDITN